MKKRQKNKVVKTIIMTISILTLLIAIITQKHIIEKVEIEALEKNAYSIGYKNKLSIKEELGQVSNLKDGGLTATIEYSTREITDVGVTVTIKANKELKEIDGWNLLEDKKTLTKTYRENVPESTITIFDTNNNSTTLKIEAITNIDKTLQNAFKEVENSYYMRGTNIQYNEAKTQRYFASPEDNTCQNTNYTVCDGYSTSVYCELMGELKKESTGERVRIPFSVNLVLYAKKHLGETEVVAYGIKENDNQHLNLKLDKNNVIPNPNVDDVLQLLKPGDIIKYKKSETNTHTILIYDLIYNDKGEVIDAYVMHAWQNDIVSSKISTKRIAMKEGEEENVIVSSHSLHKLIYGTHFSQYADLSNNFYYNENVENAMTEGTVRLTTLKKFNQEGYGLDEIKEVGILRLLTIDSNGEIKLNFHAEEYDKNGNGKKAGTYEEIKEFDNTTIELPEKTMERVKYSKLYIEKTVDKFTDNVVRTNDTLTYKIVIKNNSTEDYKNNLIVTENLSEYVNFEESISPTITSSKNRKVEANPITKENGSIIQKVWNIGKLKAKEEIIIEYAVTVKEGNYGKTIESTGTVGKISSGIIKNLIGNNLTNSQENIIREKYEEVINDSNYNGKELISEIYKRAFGINLDLKINAEYLRLNGKISDDDPYKKLVLNSNDRSLSIAEKHTNEGAENDEILYENSLRYWSSKPGADTIYPEMFKTGDILIYKNTNDVTYGINGNIINKKPVTYENGEYAYIYIEGKGFVGINLGSDKTKGTDDDRNEFNATYYKNHALQLYSGNNSDEEFLEYANYQTLFGKDYYVILRPAIGIDLVPMELNVTYSTKNYTNKDVVVTVKSNEEMLNIEGWTLSKDKLTLTKTFTQNSTEKLKVYDYSENEKIVEIKVANIDKTAPAIKGLEEGKEYYTQVTLEVEDENLKEAKLYKDEEEKIFKQGAKILEIGKYKIVATDKAGNKTEKQFIIYVKGDASGDGKFTETDLFQAKRHIVGLEKFTPEKIIRADMNGDEKITLTDLTIMKVRLVKLDTFME